MKRTRMTVLVFCFALLLSCSPDTVTPPAELTQVKTEQMNFRDAYGRYVFLNGVNASGTAKVPVSVDPVSYVGRPFKEEEADEWFAKLSRDGFNSIRYIATWDAVNHEAPGVYDTEYLDYLENMVQAANRHGIYVLVNFHENLFSRHFYSVFNDKPELGEPGSLESMLGSLFPAEDPETGELYYDSRVEGDGAPRWAVEACAPEKNLDHQSYGMLRLLGSLAKPGNLNKIIEAMTVLLGGGDMGDSSELISFFTDQILTLSTKDYIPFNIDETNDMFPFTLWAMNSFFSVDVEKCYAAFFAGDVAFPDRYIDGKQIKDYLQEGHMNAWLQVVKRLKNYPNVIGYDMMNEPTGIFIILSVLSAYVSAGFDNTAAFTAVSELLGEDTGNAVYNLIDGLEILPSLPIQLEQEHITEQATEPLLRLARNAAEAELMLLLSQLPTDIDDNAFVAEQTAAIQRAQASIDSGLTSLFESLAKGSAYYTEAIQTELQEMANKAIEDYMTGTIETANADLQNLPVGFDAEAGTLIKVRAMEKEWESVSGAANDSMSSTRMEMIAAYWNEIKADWGLADFDVLAGLGLNMNFDRNYVLRYFTRLGSAIQKEDPNAIVWVGDSLGLGVITGGDGIPMTNSSMYKPDELGQLVSAYHTYPGSIYPLGLWQVPPQSYEPQEWARRDYSGEIEKKINRTLNSYGDVPVVFTEFGTYFNFNWNLKDKDQILETLEKDGYEVSATILNMEYEAMDTHFAHRMVWCMSPENDYQLGDLWNHEDFSVYGPDREPRAAEAWIRPVPRFVAGEPIAMHFHSDYHWFDPDKGQPEDWEKGEFYLSYESKESEMPSEIYVPELQYPEGFYVWFSDGWGLYDKEAQTLYHYPDADDPEDIHEITIRRPLEGREMEGWSLYFDGERLITATRN